MNLRWLSITVALLFLAPPLLAEEAKKNPAKTYSIPYRLTDTQHVLVRVKINGKGPYNFILDTGAPALFVSTAVCKKLGIEPDKKGWGTFDRFELEGGAVIAKATGRIEDPFQLKGMNKMGLAGAELHGMIGYQLLARYRMTFDFTKDKLVWTELDYTPPAPQGLEGGSTAGMDAMAGLSDMLASFLGRKGKLEVLPRGYLGIEWLEGNGEATICKVTAGSPADKAGLKAEDRVNKFQGKSVKISSDIQRLAAKMAAGEKVTVTVQRGAETLELTLTSQEGF